MRRRKTIGLGAIRADRRSRLAACGGGSLSTTTATAGFNAAMTSVVNPSTTSGGTIIYNNSTPAGLSPTRATPTTRHMWNFTRLYATPLMTYSFLPGYLRAATRPGARNGTGHGQQR